MNYSLTDLPLSKEVINGHDFKIIFKSDLGLYGPHIIAICKICRLRIVIDGNYMSMPSRAENYWSSRTDLNTPLISCDAQICKDIIK